MSEHEVLKNYFGANVYPKEITDKYEIQSRSIGDDVNVTVVKNELKKQGYTVKSKSYSEFTSIKAVRRRR